MRVERLDHLVLTVTDLAATLSFYTRVCGMSHIVFGDDERHALAFGDQKINLHVWGTEHEPKAALTTPGSADLCFVVDAPPQAVVARLTDLQVPIEAGPQARVGATGPITSVYVRDPDGNLVELASYTRPERGPGQPGQGQPGQGRPGQGPAGGRPSENRSPG